MLNNVLKWTSVLATAVFCFIWAKLNLEIMYSIPWWDWNILNISVLWPVIMLLYFIPITFFVGLPLTNMIINHLTKEDK